MGTKKINPAAIFDKCDADNNGDLTLEEGKACVKADAPTIAKLPAKIKRKLRKFAKKLKKVAKNFGNKDGKITKAEFVATAVWVSCSKRGAITKKSGAACKKFIDLGPK